MSHSVPLTGTAVCLALLGTAWLTAWHPSARQPRPIARAPRVAVFFEPGFPSIDIEPLSEATLRDALTGYDVVFLPADRLASDLDTARFDVLVMPYGSAFPREPWPAIYGFLQAGGSWVNLGGRPFAIPVSRADGAWVAGDESTAYHKALGFTHIFAVPTDAVATWKAIGDVPAESALVENSHADVVFEADVRLASTKDFPAEDGSDGMREGRVRPLVVGIDRDGTPIVAPYVRIDRLAGACTGGAWLLASLRGRLTGGAVRALVGAAAMGALEFIARPSFAGYHPDEVPVIQVMLTRPGRTDEDLPGADINVTVRDPKGQTVATARASLSGTGAFATASVALDRLERPLARGLHEVRVELVLPERNVAARATRLEAVTGFWIYDAAMLAGGTPIGVQGGGFTRGGRPSPLTGTTYMASDVHRRFLLEPNPYLWDRDFAAMKAAGVNAIRTGIWTGWKLYMPEPGTFNEVALRSLDVFLLGARQHDLPVIFNLFAFLPEAWGGENPYLDPRAVAAQAAFAGTLARRYAAVSDLAWDLINEPSFSSAAHLWKTRPNYDPSEAGAWLQWLRARYGAGGGDALALARRAWGAAEGADAGLPSLEEFADRNLFGLASPRKVLDYRLFAQHEFTRWTERLKAAIRANGNTSQLLTVGQDEGGLTERPNPLFFGRAVDFTCMHTWWNNDALAWDGILARRPDRPLLIEETGLMQYERIDGAPWRSESDARNLLERKLAVALGSGGAGFVQWIWNTNPFMASDNEAGIGFFRADGTARPELGPFTEAARFLREHASRLHDRQAEDVVLLVPHSQMFSVRSFATEATQRAVRALTNHLHMPVRAAGEYALDDTLGSPRLIVAPAPRVLNEHAWQALLASVDGGATLLVTGIIDADERWLPAQRSATLGLPAASRPVAGTEAVEIGGQIWALDYRGEKLERLETAVVASQGLAVVHAIARGRGTVLWAPLPVELAESIAPTVALYSMALARAGVRAPVSVAGADAGAFVGSATFADAVLVALASESGRDSEVRVSLPRSDGTPPKGAPGVAVRLPAGRAVLMLFDRRSGSLIARTTPR